VLVLDHSGDGRIVRVLAQKVARALEYGQGEPCDQACHLLTEQAFPFDETDHGGRLPLAHLVHDNRDGDLAWLDQADLEELAAQIDRHQRRAGVQHQRAERQHQDTRVQSRHCEYTARFPRMRYMYAGGRVPRCLQSAGCRTVSNCHIASESTKQNRCAFAQHRRGSPLFYAARNTSQLLQQYILSPGHQFEPTRCSSRARTHTALKLGHTRPPPACALRLA
jgi:hypothetical protein